MKQLKGFDLTPEQRRNFEAATEVMNQIDQMEGAAICGTIECPVCSKPLTWRNNRLTGKARNVSFSCSDSSCISGRGR